MKLLRRFAWLFALALTGCDSYQQLPTNVTDKANELCASMGGVKELYVRSLPDNPKVSSSPMTTELLVICKEHDAQIKSSFRWKREV